jgi:arginine decarboxylase
VAIEIPKQYFLCAGKSEGYTELNAFDGALLDAGIGNTNLVKMSSILPPNCKKVESLRVPEDIPYGSLVPVAYSSRMSDIPGAIISASVAVAIPEDINKPGLIMEYGTPGRKDTTEKIVRQMVEKGMEIRKEKIKEIFSISAQIEVERIGAVFAAVVLWRP